VEVLALLANPALSSGLAAAAASPGRDDSLPAPRARRQVQHRLPPAEIDALVEAHQAGAPARQLAEQFKISRSTVLEHLERQGVPRRPNVRKLTDQQVEQAGTDYHGGKSLAIVAARYEVAERTLAREFRRGGVSIRARRGW
jgi:DNA-binding transcriptional ArsR family regulator